VPINKTNMIIVFMYLKIVIVVQSMRLNVYEPLPHLRGEGGCYLVG
jgi:hypothetical protein